jgi:hypothetical protein
MSNPWQPYALHILDAIAVVAVIDHHLQPLEICIRSMLENP